MNNSYMAPSNRLKTYCILLIIFCSIPLLSFGKSSKFNSISTVCKYRVRKTEVIAKPIINIHGIVTDQAGHPLVGVTIAVKGSAQGTTTGTDGEFKIDNISANAILIVSYIGYKTMEVHVNNHVNIPIQMQPSQTELNQVVVVGYGTEKKVNLTGAISTLDMETKKGQPITNASNALYGIPGLYVNLNSSAPGVDRANILIRGMGTLSSNAPLVLVDGVEYSMDQLNPNDIATITILKDASAAIYGSKAANGVILITTKKGHGKSHVNYSYYYGIQQPTIMPDLVWNPIVYMKSLDQAEINEGQTTPSFTQSQIEGYELGMKIDPLDYPANDWFKIALKNGIIQKHDLSISGGTDKYDYRFSIGYLNRNGIAFGPSNNENKYSLGLNTSVQVSKRLRVGLTLDGYYRDYTEPSYGTDDFWSYLGRTIPIENDTLADGNYGYSFLRVPGRNNWENPRMIAYEGSYKKTITQFLTTIHANYDLPWGITYGIKFGVNDYSGLLKTFIPLMYKEQALTGEIQYFNSAETAPRSLNENDYELDLHFYNTLNWRHSFRDKHNLAVMLGSSFDSYSPGSFNAEMTGYLDATLSALSAGSIYENITGKSTHESLESYFGRVDYNYKNKYLLEGIFRFDGSSRFAPGRRWGFFPGISAGWRIDKEPFLKDLNFINLLKLRASVGQLGNQAVPLYGYQSNVTLGHYYSFGGANGILSQGAAVTAYSDPTTSWETTTDYDLGLDVSLFKNHLSLTADIYKKWTTGILEEVNLPAQVGDLGGAVQNVGTVSNLGYEIELGYKNHIGNFSYNISGNISFNKNEVISLGGQTLYNYNTNLSTITKAGHPIDAYYVLDAIGIFQSNDEVAKSAFQSSDTKAGYLKYKDVDKDGIINGDDRIIVNTSSVIPKYLYAFGASLGYKGITLSAQFQGVGGILEAPMNRPATPLNNGANLTWEWVTNSWTTDRPNAKLPILTEANYGSEENYQPSTFWLRNASYLRLKTVQVRYTLPERWLNKVKINQLSIFINAENWLTFTKFKLGDPESMYNAIGLSHYPMLKTLSAGVDVTF